MQTKNQRVFFVSLGCSKNLVDSEVMLGKFRTAGAEIVEAPELAEIIVVNTCSFIHDAKEESVQAIMEMIDYKNPSKGICSTLIVAGCMAQHHFRELEKEISEVDLIIGTGEYHKIVDLIEGRAADKNKSFVGVPRYIHTENDKRVITSPFYTSWLKISEGCNRRCSFCIIPELRGQVRSRPVDSLIKEARHLVANGVRELNLISQDLSLYGRDLKNEDENNLIKLLDKLEEIEGLDWIRLLYFYPDDLTDDLIDRIASSKKVCKYLDIPVQHFSDPVLRKMNRKISGKMILEKIGKLRDKVPEIILRTSLIVGFPGESDDDFFNLAEGVEKACFNHLGVFTYSDEEGTPAFGMSGKIEREIMNNRQKIIYEQQKEIAASLNQGHIGKTMEVLVEGYHPETELLLVGRHQGQAPEIDGKVIINDTADKQLTVGEFVNVEITEVHDYDLVGRII